MSNKILSDPKIIGSGLWLNIHLKAKRATDETGKRDFVNDMNMYYEEFPCENCRKHIREYMDSHPFEPLWNMKNENGREIGMFKWSWMFHNAVNTRLRKPYLDWNTACEMYNLDEDYIEPCTNCGSEGQGLNVNSNSNNISEVPYLTTDKDQIIQGYFLRKGVEKYQSHFY